jgi:nitroreductase
MELMEALRGRRSIRRYTDLAVSEETVHELLDAAMFAPSAGNGQPWHFIVIRDRQKLSAIAEFHPYAKMAAQASVAILVCADLSLERYPGRWMLDCSAATQNILLTAHGMGVGSVWVGIYPEKVRMEEMRRLMVLPDNVMPVSLIPLGYPAETRPQPERFLEARVHRDGW